MAIERIITAHRQREGAGFIVRRPVPTMGIDHLDPFLLIDEMGPITYGPGEAIGAPDHPHRGFETVTYVLEGAVEHEDSAGHRGRLGPGDVQWMTAGAGIVHSEEPSAALRDQGGRVHGFQIWVNLPSKLKLSQPRYQEIAAANIPRVTSDDGLARGVLIDHAVETHTPIVYQDWSLDAGAAIAIATTPQQRPLVYVFEGELLVEGRRIREGQLVVLAIGSKIELGAEKPGRALVLAGVPIDEPVARMGPFVMNTDAEIAQAIRDYQSGRMGEITRTARTS